MKKTKILALLISTIIFCQACQSAQPEESRIATRDLKPASINIISTKTSPLKKIGEDDTKISYLGEIRVSGIYRQYKPGSVIGGVLCFYVDDESAHLIPAEQGKEKPPWFCFSNQKTAKKYMAINDAIFDEQNLNCIEGKAIVEISKYKVDKRENVLYDTAEFKKIIQREPYKTTCDGKI